MTSLQESLTFHILAESKLQRLHLCRISGWQSPGDSGSRGPQEVPGGLQGVLGRRLHVFSDETKISDGQTSQEADSEKMDHEAGLVLGVELRFSLFLSWGPVRCLKHLIFFL